jgi:hypothetical protein
MGGDTLRAGTTDESNIVPAGFVWATRKRIGEWAAKFLGLPSASLVKVHWVSICSGKQSDFTGVFQSDTYETVDIDPKAVSAAGDQADVIMDVAQLDFHKLEAEAKLKHPEANVIVIACWPPCTCFCTLNTGTNNRYMGLKGVQGDGKTMIWGPQPGGRGKRARGDSFLFDHIAHSSAALAAAHFEIA